MFNFIDWEKTPVLTATFAGTYKSVGKFKKNVHTFKYTENGKKKVVHSWGLVGLNNVLYGVPFQTKVKITYLGWAKMPDSEREFKNFEIEILDSPPDEEIPEFPAE